MWTNLVSCKKVVYIKLFKHENLVMAKTVANLRQNMVEMWLISTKS